MINQLDLNYLKIKIKKIRSSGSIKKALRTQVKNLKIELNHKLCFEKIKF